MIPVLLEQALQKLMSDDTTAEALLVYNRKCDQAGDGSTVMTTAVEWARYVDAVLTWPAENLEDLCGTMQAISALHDRLPQIGYEHQEGLLTYLCCQATTMICEADIVLSCEKVGKMGLQRGLVVLQASLINAVSRLFWLQNDFLVQFHFQGPEGK